MDKEESNLPLEEILEIAERADDWTKIFDWITGKKRFECFIASVPYNTNVSLIHVSDEDDDYYSISVLREGILIGQRDYGKNFVPGKNLDRDISYLIGEYVEPTGDERIERLFKTLYPKY